MSPDFRDIRFSDKTGRPLKYWIESSVERSYAKVWVALPASSSMYLYYGNHAAISESDGAGVFEVFDDFVGSSLSSLWSGSATVSDGVASISSVIYSTE